MYSDEETGDGSLYLQKSKERLIIYRVMNMARTARAVGDSRIYHVMLRGINRQRIFEDDEDRERFLEILKKSKEKDVFDLLAWCLMPNHVHLLIKENEVKLGTIFRRIGAAYESAERWRVDPPGVQIDRNQHRGDTQDQSGITDCTNRPMCT